LAGIQIHLLSTLFKKLDDSCLGVEARITEQSRARPARLIEDLYHTSNVAAARI
jgi:hypothetical protein